MLALNNIFNSIVSFYKGLESDSKFIFIIVVILLLIVVVLILVLIEQMHLSKKALKAAEKPHKEVEDKVEDKTEILDMDIDENNEKTRNLQEISQKIQEVLESRNNGIVNYEKEQEETSIISYEELLKAVGKNSPGEPKVENNTTQEVVRKIEPNEKIVKEEPVITKAKEERFRNSDFISPIYGIQNKTSESVVETPRVIEPLDLVDNVSDNTEEIILDSREISNGITYNEEKFLSTLKKLRNDLD